MYFTKPSQPSYSSYPSVSYNDPNLTAQLSFGPPSQHMFGGSSIHGGASSSFLPVRKPRYYTAPDPPSIWDKASDWFKNRDYAGYGAGAGDYKFQDPAMGPRLSPGKPGGGRSGYRNVPAYRPPMPMGMDVNMLLRLLEEAQNKRASTFIRRRPQYIKPLV